jgi:hypothetical protein
MVFSFVVRGGSGLMPSFRQWAQTLADLAFECLQIFKRRSR